MRLHGFVPALFVLSTVAGCGNAARPPVTPPDQAHGDGGSVGGDAGADAGDMTPGEASTPSTPGISVSPPSGTDTSKHGKTVTFTVVLDARPSAAVTLPLLTDKPNVATLSAEQLVFTAANWSTPQTVTVTGVQDNRITGPQSFTVVLSRAFSSDPAYDGIDPVDFTLVNLDDNVAGLTLTPSGPLMVDTTGASASFTVQLATEPTAPVTIGVTSGNPNAGVISAGDKLVFAPSAWSTPQTVTLKGVTTQVADGDHDFDVTLAVVATTDVDYGVLAAATVKAHDSNLNHAGIEVDPKSIVTHANGYGANISVRLTSQPTSRVYVDPFTSDATHGGTVSTSSGGANATLTFETSNWNQWQYFTVFGANDHTVGPDVAYQVTLRASSGDAVYDTLAPLVIAATNVDDNTAGITTVQTPALLTTTEAGGSATFTVVLHSKPSAAVTIPLTSSKPGEGTPAPATLVFQPSEWATPKTVTVTGQPDGVADGDQAYVIHVGPSTSSDANYDGKQGTDVKAVNLDGAAHFLTTTRVTHNGAFQNSYVQTATSDLRWVVVNTGYDVAVLDGTTGKQTVVDVTPSGTTSVTGARGGSISQDGRYVVFSSSAADLIAGDTNRQEDVFLRDLTSGVTTRVSVGPNGEEGNGGSTQPVISADGAFVAYESAASNLVAGDSDKMNDIFLWQRATGKTTLIAPGTAAALSADGQVVAFVSIATTLVAGDTNGVPDVFVYDRSAGQFTRVSVSSAGAQCSVAAGGYPHLSADGRFVLFSADDSTCLTGKANGSTLYVHDRQTHTTTPASVDESGAPLQSSCIWTGLSGSGRYVAFTAHRPDAGLDAVYVYDLVSGTSKRVYGDWGYLCAPVPADDFQRVLFSGRPGDGASDPIDVWLGLSQ